MLIWDKPKLYNTKCMKILGVFLTCLGLLLFLSCFVTRRRLRMQEEQGDTWLEERAEEDSKKLGLPKEMVRITQHSIDLGLKIATVCLIGGLSMIVF